MTTGSRAILLAIGGGIAAYKSAVVCSRLVQSGNDLRTAMTGSATRFVGPTTFAALSGKPVAMDSFDSNQQPLGGHIECSRDLDLMIVAPATANLLSKFANGLADDLVSTLYLQVECPVLLAPAMSASMWGKPSVQRNIATLRRDGCHVVGPDTGWLSCRVRGEGRMSEPEAIIEAARTILEA
ncbi:flavoprotein [Novipirellula artificiosorum]|uniref:Phosphopantothenoylcysteine decarboxylase n=1 Tax=Novipirellula artificiosorum TaxID=2528016 RepID=A0A5C6DF10_9BACT|nr:flavoprotein [Novipirellula artificiosorum]TWU34407.1 Phosphopantothenoylcysteine decarboxylase [Novipirellula artificiosorum]